MKNSVLTVVAVLSAPLLYGLICVPLVALLAGAFPELVNEAGGTHDVMLTLQIESVQLIALVLIGAVVAAIAPSHRMRHVGIAVAVMMVIGVMVQLSAWDAMLVWHHFVFFACILLGLPAGAIVYGKLRPEAEVDSGA